VPKDVGRRYAEHEKTEALKILAASKSLRDAVTNIDLQWGYSPSFRQLGAWRQKHPDIWKRAQELDRVEQETRIGKLRRRLKEESAGAALEATEVLREQIRNREIQDYGKAAKDAAVTFGIVTDKDLIEEGKPNQIHHSLTGEQILRKLQARGMVRREFDADGSVEEPREIESGE
jgi:hypothetical protein